MTYTTRAELIAQVAQIRRDIEKMNSVANAAARAQGYCEQWEAIIRKINKETLGRLALKGRPGYPSTDYELEALTATQRQVDQTRGVAGCDCEVCRRERGQRR